MSLFGNRQISYTLPYVEYLGDAFPAVDPSTLITVEAVFPYVEYVDTVDRTQVGDLTIYAEYLDPENRLQVGDLIIYAEYEQVAPNEEPTPPDPPGGGSDGCFSFLALLLGTFESWGE